MGNESRKELYMKSGIMFRFTAITRLKGMRCALLLLSHLLYAVSAQAANISYQIVIQEGDAVPGATGNFSSFEQKPGINNHGQVVFGGTVAGNFIEGLWAGTPGNLALVALEDANAPELPGVRFDFFADDEAGLMLADDGRVAFGASLKGTGVVVSNNFAMFVGFPGAIQLVMREGSLAPGTTNKVFIQPSSTGAFSYSFLLRENGLVAFGAQENGAQTLGNNQQGIWRGTAGSLQPIARAGQTTANGILNRVETADAVLGQDGTAYFRASTGTAMGGIWRGNGGTPERLVVQGGVAPGTGGLEFSEENVSAFTDLGFFEPDGLAFRAELQNPGGPLSAVEAQSTFAGRPDTLNLLVQGSNSVPGVPGAFFSDLRKTRFNTNNALLAIASFVISGSVTATNDQAYFYSSQSSLASWKLIAREGSSAPGISGARFDSSGSWGLFPDFVCFNNSGMVAFQNRLAGPGLTTANKDCIWLWNPQTEALTLIARTGTPIDFGNGDVRTPSSLSFRGGDGRGGGKTAGLNDQNKIVFQANFVGFPEAIVIASFATSPALSVKHTARDVIISWPSASAGFQLERTGSLSPPVQWQSVANGIQDNGMTKSLTVTKASSVSDNFYLLRRTP